MHSIADPLRVDRIRSRVREGLAPQRAGSGLALQQVVRAEPLARDTDFAHVCWKSFTRGPKITEDTKTSTAIELATELTIAWLSNPNTRATARSAGVPEVDACGSGSTHHDGRCARFRKRGHAFRARARGDCAQIIGFERPHHLDDRRQTLQDAPSSPFHSRSHARRISTALWSQARLSDGRPDLQRASPRDGAQDWSRLERPGGEGSRRSSQIDGAKACAAAQSGRARELSVRVKFGKPDFRCERD